MITKTKLEELAQKYETEDFIKDDPIQFAHRFMPKCHCEALSSFPDNIYSPKQSCSTLQDIEIVAFVASLFAYGNRKVFIKKLDELFSIMQNKPLEFVLKFNCDEDLHSKLDLNQKCRLGLLTQQQKSNNALNAGQCEKLKGFNYRFAKDFDVIEVFNILNKLYTQDGGLKSLFEYGYKTNNSIISMLQTVTDYFYSNVKNEVSMGFYHLIPNPKNGGAMKRMCMLLRWMVRKPPVDLGIWDFIPVSELLIPLDVHVARLSREMGLLKRSSNDFKAVMELSQNLKEFCPQDPVKYDFAIFGLGVNQ